MQPLLLQVKNLQYTAEQLLDLDLKTQKREILHDVNLTIQRQEFVGLVGPNGSGKTTLGKLLVRILEPTAGQLMLNGQDYHDIQPAWRLNQMVGMVFQNIDTQFIGKDFMEDVTLYLGNFGWTAAQIQNQITDISRQLKIQSLIKRPFKTLSGGQKQLLAIAEVLLLRPQLLILDEPTAQLDPENTRLVLNVLQKIKNEQQLAVLLITHKLSELALTQRTLILNQGTIVQQCQTPELLTDAKLLEANQLPLPDTIAILQKLNQLTGQSITTASPAVQDFVQTIQENLC